MRFTWGLRVPCCEGAVCRTRLLLLCPEGITTLECHLLKFDSATLTFSLTILFLWRWIFWVWHTHTHIFIVFKLRKLFLLWTELKISFSEFYLSQFGNYPFYFQIPNWSSRPALQMLKFWFPPIRPVWAVCSWKDTPSWPSLLPCMLLGVSARYGRHSDLLWWNRVDLKLGIDNRDCLNLSWC